ncbi:MAG: carbohydrate porin [Bdellovibrionaceae bacterium]|nr:carbohydrate porin [Bdellovibrionales bacterium]MCB9086478.1 carbohydrate porin [Pseudobdellovibrionaceae bacterium]
MNFFCRSLLLGVGLCVSFAAGAVHSENFEYNGYFRASTGTNSKGGDQECFTNSGTTGNEFRLGNECSIYGEAAFTAHHLKAQGETDPFFKSTIRLAYISPGHAAYEGTNEELHLTEAFVKGGRFHDTPYTFWAGKRFYRGPDLYMNDWWYWGNTIGNGAGVEDVPLGFGQLALAQIRQIGTTQSDVGRHGLTLWDARVSKIEVTENTELEVWLGYAHAPNGTSGATIYEKATGYVAGTKFHTKLGEGFNIALLVAGQGLMESLELSGDTAPVKNVSTQDKAQRLRIADHWTHFVPDSKWAFHLMAMHEQWDTGADTDSAGTWTGIGVHPVYFLTDHVHLTGQVGFSQVEIESEKDGMGDPLGARTLIRATVAPQLAINRSVWGRPVLRAFYTHSWWNKENKAKIATGAPAYADLTSGGAYGFQAEVWF